MLSKAYEARDNYTALLGIIKSYVNQKFQYTTLKDFYHSDPEERDRNSQYMYGDCDVMAEQVVFYLTQL
jgi:hypothetical protein